MKLFRRQKSIAGLPPELQPVVGNGNTRSRKSNLILKQVAVTVLIAVLILGAGTWLGHHVLHRSSSRTAQPVGQSPQTNKAPASKGEPAQTPTSGQTNNGTVGRP